ncbi:hypothetical protein MTO96_019360 [Rhipicephalus appendiculatus]
MGRRRIVRTPSEEREHQLRRKEMRRARIRAQTDEQRAIARAKHAELQRRRRQNAALREREAADRRRRREDPEVRQLEAAKHRARREIEAVRLREIEARRLHRQNAANRQHDAEAHRTRRREDAALRRREAEARRQRRQDPEVRQLEAAKHRLRRQDAATPCGWVQFLRFPGVTVTRIPLYPVELCDQHSLCSSDYEDSQSLHRLARRLDSGMITQEGKVDCCLQTDGTGKIDGSVQTENAAKMTFEVPSKKFLKVAEVQTEESSWLQVK